MAPTTTETFSLLVVSRQADFVGLLSLIAQSNCWRLETVASGWEAMECVQSDAVPQLLLLDLPSGDDDGLHILRWMRRFHPNLPVIVTCHPEDAAKQKEATSLGAEGVLVRPFGEGQLELLIRRQLLSSNDVAEAEMASEDIESVGADEFFLSASPVMQKLRAQAESLSLTDVPVLILGEPGSGKRTVARLIHKLSVFSGFNFLRVDCAEMPGHLLEIELFGRSNGDFNGSSTATDRASRGKLAVGQKGTILLDEITKMPLELQSRFLQLLQEKRFTRAADG